MAQPHLSLILPAFNEERVIARTLVAAVGYLTRQEYGFEILVGVDGTDGTRAVATQLAREEPRLRVFGQTQRRGKGKAVRDGVELATGELIGFADADDKVPIEALGEVLPWLERGFDVAVGSRRVEGAHVERAAPLHRRVGSRLFAHAVRWAGVDGIADSQCGFKFFRAEVARDLCARQRTDGYMFDVELLGLAQIRGYRIREVGVPWRHDSDTRYDPVLGTWQNFVEIRRIRAALARARREAAGR